MAARTVLSTPKRIDNTRVGAKFHYPNRECSIPTGSRLLAYANVLSVRCLHQSLGRTKRVRGPMRCLSRVWCLPDQVASIRSNRPAMPVPVLRIGVRRSVVTTPKLGLVSDLQQHWERAQNLTSTRNRKLPMVGVCGGLLELTSASTSWRHDYDFVLAGEITLRGPFRFSRGAALNPRSDHTPFAFRTDRGARPKALVFILHPELSVLPRGKGRLEIYSWRLGVTAHDSNRSGRGRGEGGALCLPSRVFVNASVGASILATSMIPGYDVLVLVRLLRLLSVDLARVGVLHRLSSSWGLVPRLRVL
ncbi:hypothetical protein R1flu_015877 [Riccia fluitans]|uniref:Uncharacterized protein n=1 Tax=Riccia fluitans TaxID=41844 RepID=A0ABD1YKN6_9MARC